VSLRKVQHAAQTAAAAIARITSQRAPRPTTTAHQLTEALRRDQAPELLEALREKL